MRVHLTLQGKGGVGRVHEDSRADATGIVGTAVTSGIAEIQEATKSFTQQISAW